MNLVITPLPKAEESSTFELVERKGLGHPDTICDALAEEISLALSRYYVDHFGKILHHNVDKILLRGGSSNPIFGGGEITAPIEICLGGRATLNLKGSTVPVKDIALDAAKNWFRKNLPELDIEKDVRLNCLIRPGSRDLVELYLRQNEPLANDTSVGVGFAPFSKLEQAVLEVDRFLHSPGLRARHPEVGSDTKVMAFHNHENAELTVACAFISRFISSMGDYFDKKEKLKQLIAEHSQVLLGEQAGISLNAADDRARESIYLTVSGTSAEAGDDGQVGRGNRVTGLITPHRPMSLEAAAGKNPVSHTGKIYQIAAHRIAQALVKRIPELSRAECFLLSQIGSPISKPQIIHVRVEATGECQYPRNIVEEVVQEELSQLSQLPQEWLDRPVPVY